jgi:heat shock transcription factor 1
MHSVEELGTNVPAFLAKLWKIVEDPETNDLICWSSVRNQTIREISLSLNHAFVKLIFIYCCHDIEFDRSCSLNTL